MNKSKLFSFPATALLSLLFLLTSMGLRAQVASCEVTLANDVVIDASHYAFDVYVKSTNNVGFPAGFPYGNAAYKWTYNAAIKNTAQSANAVVRGMVIANSTELTNTAQANNTVTNPSAAISYFRIPTRSPVPYAESSIISNTGMGTKIFRFMMVSRDTVAGTYIPFTPNVTANITLTIASPSGTLVTYVVPAGTVSNTNPQVLINTNLGNPILNVPVTPPTAYALTGGGFYCQGAGGLPVGLANSQAGVSYTLIKDGSATATVVPGTGSAISFGNQLSGTYTASGTSNGTISSISGTTAMTGNAVITENPSIAASVTIAPDANTVCTNTPVLFTPTPVGGGSTPTYQWFKNTVSVATTSTYSYVPLNGDVVYAVMTSNAACVTGSPATSPSVTMAVNPAVAASVSVAPSANNICAGTSVTFTATPVGGGTTPAYQWYKNTVAMGSGATYNYVPLNNDVVYVVMTSNATCATGSPSTSNSVTMVVNPTVAASVTITPDANNVCVGTIVTFYATPVNGGPGPIIGWNINGVFVGTGEAMSYNPINNDVVTAQLTSNATCVTGSPALSNTVYMVVNFAVAASVTVSPSQNNICAGTSVTFTPTPVGGGTTPSYQWYKNTVAVSTNPTYTYVPANGDVVYVKMTSSLSCASGSPASSAITTMVVNPVPAPAITGPATACVSSVINNFYYSEPGMTGYIWTVSAGGTIASGGSGDDFIGVNWTTSGAKTVSVNYSGAGSCTAATPTVYNVTVNPLPVPTVTGPATAGSGTFQVYITQAGMTGYTWTVSAGGSITSGSTSNAVTILWNTAGAQTVSVNYTNASSCAASTPTIYNVSVTSVPATAGIISGPASVCQGASGMVYTVAALPTATGYVWTLPAGATITSGDNTNTITVSFSYAAVPGNITVYGTNSYGNGTASPNFVLNVNSAPSPTITGGPISACLNSTGNVYTTQTGMTGYTWTVVGGTITAGGTTTSNTATVTWTATGIKSISINYSNSNGCTAATATIQNVTVNALPIPFITGPATACVNSTSNSYTTAAAMTAYTWTVSAGGTITAGSGTNTVTVTWNTAGAQTVSVNYTNASGCTAPSAPVNNVTVNALPLPVITGPVSACAASTGNSYTTATGMTAYTWTISAGGTITAGAGTNAVTVTWNTAGAQNVYVNYTNTDGCTAAAPSAKSVTVNPLPVPTITGPASACVGSAGVIYTTEATMTGYTWTISAGGTITAGAGTNAITVTWNTAGAQNVYVNYANANGCNAAAPTAKSVTVNPLPVPTITGLASVCLGTAGVTYTTEATMTAYTWTVSAGGSITAGSGTNAITVSWSTVGAKTISVNYINANGCTATAATVKNITVNPLPVPTITGLATACIGAGGNTYMTEASMTGYAWTVSTGGTINTGAGTNTITVTWNTAGAHNVYVNYVNVNGCTASAPTAKAITVSAVPVPTITGLSSTCLGTSVTYTTEAAMTGYAWTLSAGGTITAGAGTNVITVVWNTAGTKAVHVNYANSAGCSALTPASFNVTVVTAPAPTITGPVEACAGSTNVVYTTEAGFSNYSWTISYGGIITAGLITNQVSVTWSTAGQRSISVNYQNTSGCSAGSPSVQTVNVLSVPDPIISGNNAICQGSTGVVYTTQPNNSGYAWTVSTGGIITSGAGTNSVTITWNSGGNQTVSVDYTNALGCGAVAPAVFNVTVSPKPAAAAAITGTTPICAGSLGVTYTVPTIANATSYNWTVPSGATISSGGTSNAITVNFAESATTGIIKVNGVNDCGSGTSSPNFTVVVNPIPATPVITQHGDTLTSSANTGNQWYLNGVAVSGATGKRHVAVYTGNYTVVVTLTGCSSAPSNSILVLPVGISDISISGTLDIYPNPNKGQFTVKVETVRTEEFTIEIYSSLGAMLWKQEDVMINGTYTTHVDLEDAPTGVYMVALRNKANIMVKKVIIMK